MVERKITSKELAKLIGTTQVNMSKIKSGRIRGVRFSTLEALCVALQCQPGDLIECDDLNNLSILNTNFDEEFDDKTD